MSVQLKPGQLISVQRTPSINHIPVHCALNAPHHVNSRSNNNLSFYFLFISFFYQQQCISN